jgi:RNA polymerase II subunit A small phosphatase-like protein
LAVPSGLLCFAAVFSAQTGTSDDHSGSKDRLFSRLNPVSSDRDPPSPGSPPRSGLFRFRRHTPLFVPPPRKHGKKTLVLDLDETLIHSAAFPPHSKVEFFTLGDPQLYVFKRPGLDPFLQVARGMFDTFIFTYGDRGYA